MVSPWFDRRCTCQVQLPSCYPAPTTSKHREQRRLLIRSCRSSVRQKHALAMLLSADIQGPTSTKAIGIVITWAGPDVHADQEDHRHGVGCMPRGPASWFAGEPHLHAKRCNAASLGRRRGPLGWTPRPSRLSVSGSLWLVSWPFCQSSRPVRASFSRVERTVSVDAEILRRNGMDGNAHGSEGGGRESAGDMHHERRSGLDECERRTGARVNPRVIQT